MALTSDEKKNGIWVLSAGFTGGFLSWTYSMAVGTKLAAPWYGAIPMSCILGAGAAFFSVFVLANSDMRQFLRAMAFAAMCGFAWKPVYDATGALVQQTVKQRAESKVVSQAD